MVYIIVTTLCIIFGCIIGIYEEGDLGSALMGMLAGMLIGISISFCTLIMASICVNCNVEYISENYSCNIVALKDNEKESGSLDGSFVLGCGKISGQSDSKMVYSYLKDTQNGLIMCHTDCDKSYVKTTNGQPKVEITNKYSISKASDKMKKWFWITGCKEKIETLTTFYIPENGICYEYNIDME